MANNDSVSSFRCTNVYALIFEQFQKIENIIPKFKEDLRILGVDPKEFALKELDILVHAHQHIIDLRFEIQRISSKAISVMKGINRAIDEILKYHNNDTSDDSKKAQEWIDFIKRQLNKIIKVDPSSGANWDQEIIQLVDRIKLFQGELNILKILFKDAPIWKTEPFDGSVYVSVLVDLKAIILEMLPILSLIETPDPLSTLRTWGRVGSTHLPPLHGKEYDAELEKVGWLAVTPEQIKKAVQFQQEMEEYAREQNSDD